MNARTASTLLAKAQGGIFVKGSLQKKLQRSDVEAIFGKNIPIYTVTETLKVSLKPMDEDFYLLSVCRA